MSTSTRHEVHGSASTLDIHEPNLPLDNSVLIPEFTPPLSRRDHLSTKTQSALQRLNGRKNPAPSVQAQHQISTHNSERSADMHKAASTGGDGRFRSRSGSIPGQSRQQGGEAEVTATIMLWHPAGRSAASALSKTPILRDVPSVKQKLSKRGSSATKAEVGPAAGFERSITLKHSSSSWLKEKPSKSRLSFPNTSGSGHGSWRRATALFRDNGVLTIFNEDHALLHWIQCSSLSATDVRCIDDSIFGRSHVLGIFARPSSFHGGTSASAATLFAQLPSPGSGQLGVAKQDAVYIHLSSGAKLQYWRALLKIYAQPEVFGPPSSAVLGGTHRRFRQIELTIFEAKSITPKVPTDSHGPHRLSSNERLSQPESARSTMSPSWLSRDLAGSPLARSTHPDKDESIRSSLDFDAPLVQADAGEPEGQKEPRLGPSRERSEFASSAKTSGSVPATPQSERVFDHGEDGRQSRAMSLKDAASNNGDDVSSIDELVSGPVTGLSGSSRFAAEAQQPSSRVQAILSRPQHKASMLRDRDFHTTAAFDRYCRIVLNGKVVARTRPRLGAGGSDAYDIEKFKLVDLPEVDSLTIEVLHATYKSIGASSTTPAYSTQKYVLLGIVEIPVDSLRRGEEVEGCFPIWSLSAVHTGTGEADGKSMPFHKGLVGELKMSIKLREDTILPLSVYREVDRRLHAADAPELIVGLAKHLSEEAVVPHLVEFYAASGSMTERLAALADLESALWGDRLEPELLFRANTLLSRSVDHFQRLLALPWLDRCVGATVRAICDDAQPPQSDAEALGPFAQFTDFEGNADRAIASRSSTSGSWLSDAPLTIGLLRKLSENLWESIYAQRHGCPAELRSILSDIRAKVNLRYERTKSTRPGIQGVGAFIFLRLFCAALNAPQLYGLTPCQPSRGSQRKLLLLSKVLLALANKKMSFDKDKDRDLLPLNDFLRTYASAFDDYITVVSTEPPKVQKPSLLGVSYDDDEDLQRSVQRKLEMLPVLHKESIPTSPYMLDRPLTLASFVSFVVRNAEEMVDDADTHSEEESGHGHLPQDSNGGESGGNGTSNEIGMSRSKKLSLCRRVEDLVELCCEIEGHAGRFIEAAGYNAQPICASRDTPRSGAMTRLGSVVTTGRSPAPFPHVSSPSKAKAAGSSPFTSALDPSGASTPNRSRSDQSPGQSPSSARARSATITASPFRSPDRGSTPGDRSLHDGRKRFEYPDQARIAPMPLMEPRDERALSFSPSSDRRIGAARIMRVSEEDSVGGQPDEAPKRALRGVEDRSTANGSALLETEDGSRFEPVYAANPTPTEQRHARVNRSVAHASSSSVQMPATSPLADASAGRRPGPRSSFVTPKAPSVLSRGMRRHSSDMGKVGHDDGGQFLAKMPRGPSVTWRAEDDDAYSRHGTGDRGDRICSERYSGDETSSVRTSDVSRFGSSAARAPAGEKKKRWWRPG